MVVNMLKQRSWWTSANSQTQQSAVNFFWTQFRQQAIINHLKCTGKPSQKSKTNITFFHMQESHNYGPSWIPKNAHQTKKRSNQRHRAVSSSAERGAVKVPTPINNNHYGVSSTKHRKQQVLSQFKSVDSAAKRSDSKRSSMQLDKNSVQKL